MAETGSLFHRTSPLSQSTWRLPAHYLLAHRTRARSFKTLHASSVAVLATSPRTGTVPSIVYTLLLQPAPYFLANYIRLSILYLLHLRCGNQCTLNASVEADFPELGPNRRRGTELFQRCNSLSLDSFISCTIYTLLPCLLLSLQLTALSTSWVSSCRCRSPLLASSQSEPASTWLLPVSPTTLCTATVADAAFFLGEQVRRSLGLNSGNQVAGNKLLTNAAINTK